MSITHVQQKFNAGVAGASLPSWPTTFSAGTAAGSAICVTAVVTVGGGYGYGLSAISCADDHGNDYVALPLQQPMYSTSSYQQEWAVQQFYALNVAAGTSAVTVTPTIHPSSGELYVIIHEFSASTSLLVNTSSGVVNDYTVSPPPTLSLAAPSDSLIYGAFVGSSYFTRGADSGYTLGHGGTDSGTGGQYLDEWRIQPSAASTTVSGYTAYDVTNCACGVSALVLQTYLGDFSPRWVSI